MKKRKLVSAVKGLAFTTIFIFLFVMVTKVFQLKWTQAGAGNTVSVDEFNDLPEDSVDVFFMGTSHVWFGIDPWYLYEKTGITSYVVANGSSRMEELYVLLEDSLKHQTPKVVYLDASMFHYKGANTESRAHRILDQIPLTDTAKWEFAFNNRVEDMSASDVLLTIFRYHSRWSELEEKDFTYVTGDYEVAPSRGHYIDYGSVQAKEGLFEEPLDEPFAIEEYQIEYFYKFKKLLDDIDCELVLIKIPNPDWNIAYSEAVQELADEAGVEFVDMTYDLDEIGLDFSTDYKDKTDHLNQYGCEKVMDYIIDSIIPEYSLEDHRDGNDLWNQELEEYLAYKESLETDKDQ